MKTQPCSIIPPGDYEQHTFDSTRCYVCAGNLKLKNCHLSSKLYVVGNLISNRSILKNIDVGGVSILKDSVCDELISFLSCNIFRSNVKKIITHDNTFLQNVMCEEVLTHGKLHIAGMCEIKQIRAFT